MLGSIINSNGGGGTPISLGPRLRHEDFASGAWYSLDGSYYQEKERHALDQWDKKGASRMSMRVPHSVSLPVDPSDGHP
jgi:hypothetical protein